MSLSDAVPSAEACKQQRPAAFATGRASPLIAARGLPSPDARHGYSSQIAT